MHFLMWKFLFAIRQEAKLSVSFLQRDMKISASYDLEHFLDRDYIKYYINPSGINVLEVKFDDILPSYIRKIVESYGFKQISFSKYYYGRKIIDSYMR